MKIISKKFLIFIIFICISICLKSNELRYIQTIDQFVLLIFNYIDKMKIINIYENVIFVLPYLIIYIFCILDLKSYFENKDMIMSRFNSQIQRIIFIISKNIKNILKYTLTYFLFIIILSLFGKFHLIHFQLIIGIICYVIFIEFCFVMLFYLLVGLLPLQYDIVISIVCIFLMPISGFFAKYINNDYLFYYNPMVSNVLFNIELPINLRLNYTYLLLFLVLVSISSIMVQFIKET